VTLLTLSAGAASLPVGFPTLYAVTSSGGCQSPDTNFAPWVKTRRTQCEHIYSGVNPKANIGLHFAYWTNSEVNRL
jgi:hypothetical protein